MSNLALIQPQRADFDTCQTCDWLDGFPMIGTAAFGGVLAGMLNVGNGALAVSAVNEAANGAHTLAVTAIAGGLTHLSVSDPEGTITGRGVVGLPLQAGGITLTVTQGTAAFAVGDTFAIAVATAPIDITGLQFDLDARQSVNAATYALQASSAGESPTIANGGASGMIAMAVPRAVMAQAAVKPDGYPYAITATDLATGLRVPAFYGLIHHVAIPALIGAS